MSSRRLEDVFSVILFVFQDLLKTFWRRLQDVFAIRLPKMCSRRLQDVLEDKKMLHRRRLQDVFSTSSPRRMFAGKSQLHELLIIQKTSILDIVAKNAWKSFVQHATNVRTCYKCNQFWKEENVTINEKELKLDQDATECYICGKILSKKFPNDKNFRKVRNHCHFTGKYRGAVQSICNLDYMCIMRFL